MTCKASKQNIDKILTVTESAYFREENLVVVYKQTFVIKNSIFSTATVSLNPQSFCVNKPLSSEEGIKYGLLRKSVACKKTNCNNKYMLVFNTRSQIRHIIIRFHIKPNETICQ